MDLTRNKTIEIMAYRRNAAILLGLVTVQVSHSKSYSDESKSKSAAAKQTSALALQIAKRLKSGLDEDKRVYLSTTSSGIKVYFPASNFGRFGENGLPIARIGVVEIDAHIDKVSDLWADQDNRKDWDTTLSDSQSEILPETNQVVTYLARKPLSFLAPGRNFIVQVVKSPGALLGINDFNTVTYTSIDASNLLPSSWTSIRGRLNGILILQPVGYNRTKATYIIEMHPGGWFYFFPELAATFAGENVMGSLSALKAALEYNEDADLATMSIEDAARRKFAKEQTRKAAKENVTVVDDARSSKEDLQNVVTFLEGKLADIYKMENNGDNVTELKNKVASDLKKAKSRLAAMGR